MNELGKNTESESPLERMRALAHPVRIELVERIGRLGQARATDLAADMSLPVNALSYHLRLLSRARIIEHAPVPGGDRRNRVWRLLESDFEAVNTAIRNKQVSDPDAIAAATDSAAFEWVRNGYLQSLNARSEHAGGDILGPWLFPTTVTLNREEAESFFKKANELINDYKSLNRDELGRTVTESDHSIRAYRVLFAIAPEGDSNIDPD